MEELNEKDVQKMQEIFGGLEEENLEDTIKENVSNGGKVSYSEIAKKYNPSELTDDKITELVDNIFPLLGKDAKSTQKDRAARNKSRNKLKDALKKRREDSVQKNLKPKVVIQEEKNEYFPPDDKQRYIEQIKSLTNEFKDEDLEAMESEELQDLLGGLMNQSLQAADEMYVNGFYRFLCGTASIMDAQNYTDANYGISFKGVHDLHTKNEEELKQICAEILAESPEIKKYLSPVNRLALMMTQMYGGLVEWYLQT
jgi:hypothetical protein